MAAVKVESHPELLEDHARRAFDVAIEDTLTDARQRAPKRTGAFARSLELSEIEDSAGRLSVRLGSSMSSARVKEAGGYIEARNSQYLVFDAGQGVRKVKAVRIKAQPTVVPAGRAFPQRMTDALRRTPL
jgi:hypothetical protein